MSGGTLPRTGTALTTGVVVGGVEFGIFQVGLAAVAVGVVLIAALSVKTLWRRGRTVSAR